jgi:adenosylhomocysteine nucleosidase
MSRVAIVAALEREVRPLVKHWRVSEQEVGGRRYRFFEKDDFVVVCGGIGAEAARRAAEAVIASYAPKIVYSAGFAGGLDPGLRVAEILLPRRVVNAGDGSSVRLDHGEGVLVSFGSVASPEQKVRLRNSFGAQAVDMESGAVARAAEARGVEFSVVKAISDEFDFRFPSMERFVDSEGQFRESRFAWFCALRPWLWPGVLRLAKNSSRASQALCEWIRKMLAEAPAAVSSAATFEAVHRR